jgi:tetratricopeptide (TPR) repeat protein
MDEGMKTVFLSYSSKDSAFALRIFRDLSRSGLKVWHFESDAEKNTDFRVTIRKRIEASDFFCLLDSPHSRISEYVQYEVGIAFEFAKNRIDRTFRISICCLYSDGDWRQHELFEDHNFWTYFDFQVLDTYDQKAKYFAAVRGLCQEFHVEYEPWTSIPSVRDFEKELLTTPISLLERKVLLEDFQTFWFRYEQDSPNILHRLEIFVDDCRRLGVYLPSPLIAFGVLQGERGHHLDASRTFRSIIELFPNDPRGYAGCGSAEFQLMHYHDALQLFRRSYRLLLKSSDLGRRHARLPDVMLNMILIRIRIHDYEIAESAIRELRRLFPAFREVIFAEMQLAVAIADFWNAKTLFQRIREQFAATNVDDEIHSSELSGFITGIGRAYQSSEYYYEAIECFAFAIDHCPNSLRYHGELALLLYCCERYEEMEDLINAGKLLKAQNLEDTYFQGLLYFLEGNELEATMYYLNCGKKWDFYSHLIQF